MIPPEIKLWTIGHSNHSLEEFIALLQIHQIKLLADIRSMPGSNKYPHFNSDALAKSLAENGVEYRHMPELGGRRKPNPHSHNTAWESKSFQAYADYMETGEFRKGIETLLGIAREKRTAIMCSEAVWWRCHRSLVADYLKSNGVIVLHILGKEAAKIHPYTSVAHIVDGKLSYAGEADLFGSPKVF